ncbi:MAG: tetratricopeptide repeat protein [Saprospiraceae bacterium]
MTDADYLLIDRYLQAELPAAQAEKLQRRAAAEPGLAAALAERREQHEFLRASAGREQLIQLTDRLGEWHFGAETPVKKLVPRRSRRLWTGLAAAAAIALLLLLWNPFRQPDLYQKYALHTPAALVEKGDSDAAAARAEAAFNSGDYATAFPLLTEYAEAHPQDGQAKLLLGIAALEVGNYGAAQRSFKQLRRAGPVMADYGTWYLALTHLKMGDEDTAIALLRDLPGSDPYLAGRAEALLKDLGKDY